MLKLSSSSLLLSRPPTYLKKIPVVFEGQRWYSRAAAKLMQQIGLGQLVVTTPMAYIQLTIKLIDDDEFRMEMQSRIDRIDLDKLIFESDCGRYFQQAIDLLLVDREHLKSDNYSHPIRLPISQPSA
ncbi:hypothetical protein [Chamaesiphon polymorphus]|nr:hypothetical protein [Chamaesiphon polymorphus]